MILKVGLHQGDSGEEFIGRHHTQQVFTWNIEKPWKSRPGADKNFPKPFIFKSISVFIIAIIAMYEDLPEIAGVAGAGIIALSKDVITSDGNNT